jgi:predicted transcriptional regulator
LVVAASPLVGGALMPPAEVVFVPPAELHGKLDVLNASWALMFFDGPSTADVRLPGESVWENVTITRLASYDGPPAPTTNVPLNVPQSTETLVSDAEVRLHFGGLSSLYVEGASLQIALGNLSGALRPAGDICMTNVVSGMRWEDHLARYGGLCPGESGVYVEAGSKTGMDFTVGSATARVLEWHNAQTECPRGAATCPSGGRHEEWTIPVSATNSNLTNGVYGYDRFTHAGDSGMVSGQGHLAGIFFGGPGLSLTTTGSVRLPLASSSPACPNCPAPQGQTLQLDGDVRLAHFQSAQDGQMASQVSGQIQGARFDERAVDPGLLAGVAGVSTAVIIGIGILAKILWGLFARNTRPLLEHPTSKALHDLICTTPGLSFSQVRGQLALAHGTAQYHLRRLLQAGLIVAYGYRNSVRYYENHGRHKHDWQEHAAFQKPELRRLHAWIAEHPRSNQLQVISAASQWGWKRSTTQNRLRQLVEAALIRDHRTTAAAVEYVAVRPTV